MPRVSVVIPTHNRAALVDRAIRSVVAQSYSDWELVVVDDGSDDETERVVLSHLPAPIRYVRHDTCRGEGAARNTGVTNATGEFVAFLDSDDEWLPTNLTTLIDAYDSSQVRGGAVVFHAMSITDDGYKRLHSPLRGLRPMESVAHYLIAAGGDITMNTVLVPRELAKQVAFSESLTQFVDWDFWIRCQLQGATFEFVPAPVSIYHRDERADRLSMTVDVSPSRAFLLKWESALGRQTTRAFKARMIAPRLAAQGRKLPAVGLILDSARPGSLGPLGSAKVLATTLLPPQLVGKLKRLMGHVANRPNASSTG